jgi:hypothetical protein
VILVYAPKSQEKLTAPLASHVDPQNKKPSVEVWFHAYCLTLAEDEFVSHNTLQLLRIKFYIFPPGNNFAFG